MIIDRFEKRLAQREIDTSWTGNKAVYVSPVGNYGKVNYSELAMHVGVAGKDIVQFALFSDKDPKDAIRRGITWAQVMTGDGRVIDGTVGEILSSEIKRNLDKYEAIVKKEILKRMNMGEEEWEKQQEEKVLNEKYPYRRKIKFQKRLAQEGELIDPEPLEFEEDLEPLELEEDPDELEVLELLEDEDDLPPIEVNGVWYNTTLYNTEINFWEERGSATLRLMTKGDQEDVLVWHDEDVYELAEDGFFDLRQGDRKLHESVYRYAKDIGRVTDALPPEEAKRREEERLNKKYPYRRKIKFQKVQHS